MITSPVDTPPPKTLEQLLHRGDIWRGRDQLPPRRAVVDTGFSMLNTALLNHGWPLGSLIEVSQQNLSHSEWLLLTPALRVAPGGYLVLLNPPATPFAQGLIQAGINLDHILVIKTRSKADFLASFSELARTESCDALLAWQPQQSLSYTELRKCLLATTEGRGLYVLFRPASTQKQNSPAVLRIATEMHMQGLEVHIYKQKGVLQTVRLPTVQLPLPNNWQGLPAHRLLGQTSTQQHPRQLAAGSGAASSVPARKINAAIHKITPLHGRKP